MALHSAHSKPYWTPTADDRQPGPAFRGPSDRRHIFAVDAFLRNVSPVEEPIAQRFNAEIAAANGLDSTDLVAISDTISIVIDYFMRGGQLDALRLSDEQIHRNHSSLCPSNVDMLTEIATLTIFQMDNLLLKRRIQAHGYAILVGATDSENPTQADLESLLDQTEYAYLKAGMANKSRARRFLHRLHEWREQGLSVLYLFRTDSLNWRLSSDEAAVKRRGADLVHIFGSYFEHLQLYPFLPIANGSIEDRSMKLRLREYYQLSQFPGADSQHFRMCGTHWRSFEEMKTFFQHIKETENIVAIDDEVILETRTYFGKNIFSHFLFPRRIHDEWHLVAAVGIPAGSILGIVPVELRYTNPSEPEKHWFELYPHSVYCEPMPGLFSLVFERCVSSHTHGNVALVYDRVRDGLSGLGPSFRIFAVADRYIPPLEMLHI